MGVLKKIAAVWLVWLFAAPASAAATPAPRMAAVQREKETQLLFFWRRPVGFSQKNEAGRYTLSFDADAEAPVDRLKQISTALPAQWRKMTAARDGNRLNFSIVLPAGTKARAVADGRRVTLSLYERDYEPAPKTAEKNERATVPPPAFNAGSEPAPEKPVVSEKTVSEEKEVASDPPRADSVPYDDSQKNISLSLSSPVSFAEERAASEKQALKTAQAGYRAASLSFPWSRMTAAAAFRRDGYVWLVFDRQGEFDFGLERELYKDIILEMVQIPHSQATIFRLVTQKGYNPSLRREGLLWVVDLMYQPVRPRRSLDLVLQRKTPFGARIFVPLDEASQVIPLIDPEVGDLMYIVPVFSTGKGVAEKRAFVDATFLPTAQGLVVVPNVEDMNVFASTSGVEVRGPKGGLRFSSEDVLAYLAKSKIKTDPMAQILDAGAWADNTPETYLTVLKTLQANVLSAKPENRAARRLVLARYYFANGMYPETIGVLRTIETDSPDLAKTAPVVALRGAVNFMMMRYDEAIGDLSSPLLKGNAAADYWRAATLAASSRTPELYLPKMRENMAVLQSYPRPLKTRLALAGLHAAVAAGDEFSIQNFMEAAMDPRNSRAEDNEISFYHALWLESTGMYSQAHAEMKSLADGDDFYFRAMGGLEKIRMETRSKVLPADERIEELERLSYAWRGGEFEYNLMIMLVDAYREQKDFAQVLHMLKNMQVRFDGTPESKRIQKLMEEIFQKLYLNEREDVLSPVKAIALYEEFKELLPPGEKGAKIVRRLADRLVAMDLPDLAADLLDDQLRRPVGNKERGLITTRLALVRLLNKEPEKAIRALELGEKYSYSGKIAAQRKLIRAKALADLNRVDDAVRTLDGDDSLPARQLRAEILWRAQRWDQAADALKTLISKPQPNTPMTEQEAQRVLDWAAALRLAGRPKIVMRLRESFMPYMEKTKLAAAFDFITKTPQQGLLDYRQVAAEVESAETFHSFAKEYSEMVKSQGLSEAVR